MGRQKRQSRYRRRESTRQEDEEERRGMTRKQRIEERGFIEAAGESGVIAL